MVGGKGWMKMVGSVEAYQLDLITCDIYMCYLLAAMFEKQVPMLECSYTISRTAQKMRFSIKDLFSKCEQIRRELFCAVTFVF